MENKELIYLRTICIDLNYIVFNTINEWQKNVIEFIKENPSITEDNVELAIENLKLQLIKEFNRYAYPDSKK